MARRNEVSWVAVCLAMGASVGCSSSTSGGKSRPKRPDGGVTITLPDGSGFFNLDSGHNGSGSVVITPANPTIAINPNGAPPDPVQFTVTGAGTSNATWTLSNPY